MTCARRGLPRSARWRCAPPNPPLALSHYPLRQIPVGAVNLHGHLHEGTEPSRRHINLAVEQTHYSPVGLIWVLDKARQRLVAVS